MDCMYMHISQADSDSEQPPRSDIPHEPTDRADRCLVPIIRVDLLQDAETPILNFNFGLECTIA